MSGEFDKLDLSCRQIFQGTVSAFPQVKFLEDFARPCVAVRQIGHPRSGTKHRLNQGLSSRLRACHHQVLPDAHRWEADGRLEGTGDPES